MRYRPTTLWLWPLLTLLYGCPSTDNDLLFPYDVQIEAIVFELPNPADPTAGMASTTLPITRDESFSFDLVVTASVNGDVFDADALVLTLQESFGAAFLARAAIQRGALTRTSQPRGNRGVAVFRQRYTIDVPSDYDLASSLLVFGVNVRLPLPPDGPDGDAQDGRSGSLAVELQRAPLAGATPATPIAISAGLAHSLVLAADGAVYGWGDNTFDQIDDFTGIPAPRPARIALPVPARAISAGWRHSLAVSDSGSVYAWGSNARGELGPNRQTESLPELVAGVANVIDVVAGNNASFAITADGTLYAWGSNENGRLGLPGTGTIDVPTIVPVDNVVQVAAGEAHALALTTDGTVYSWGEGRYGQLGDGSASDESRIGAPAPIPNLNDVVDIAATRNGSFVLQRIGRVLAFGRNDNEVLQVPNLDVVTVPTTISVFANTVDIIASSSGDSLFIKRAFSGSRDVFYIGLGRNDNGQLARPRSGVVQELEFADLGTRPIDVAAGGEHSLSLQRTGSCGAVWSWGATSFGRLGDGRDSQEAVRAQPLPLPDLGAADCAILTVSTENLGRIASTPGAIDCGIACEDSFARGASVTLDVTNAAEDFVGFAGDCAIAAGVPATSTPLVLAMDGHRYCPAGFTQTAVNERPFAIFSTDPASPVIVGSTVTFDGSASLDRDGSIASWEWDLDGDLAIDATGTVTSFTYDTVGSYDVTLTVTDDQGLTGSQTQALQVTTAASAFPVAAFTVTPASPVQLGTELRLDASSSTDDIGITNWSWDFGNNGSFNASGEVVLFTPATPGAIDIRLRVTDADGQFNDATQTVQVNASAASFTLAVVFAGTGAGQVAVTPPGVSLPNNDCDGNECFLPNITAGTEVLLEVTGAGAAGFQGWSATECDTVSGNQCRVTMNAERRVTATFD